MTNDQIAQYYASLLIIQYANKPKAVATIKTLVAPVIMDQLPLQVRDAFDVKTAVGVQLDILGKFVGVSRMQRTFTQLVSLDDDDFRVLIQIKTVLNSSKSDLASIQAIVFGFFNGAIRLFDHQTMYMSVYFDALAGSLTLAEVFVRGDFIPRPMGVRLSALIYAPNVETLPFFGMSTYTVPALGAVGFNDYADYQQTWPWLTYQDAVA